MLRVVQICVDARQEYNDSERSEPYFGTAPAALLEGFANLRSVELHILSYSQRKLPSPEKLAPNMWFHSLCVPKLGWMRSFYVGCILSTRRKLCLLQPQLVHGQGTERQCAVCAVHSGFPNVVTIHGNMRQVARKMNAGPFTFHRMAALLEGYALRRTDGVFCNSKYTEQLARTVAQRTWRVPNALSTKFFSPVVTAPSGVPILLNAGTITEHKQQVELLSLAERLYTQGLRFRLRFAGAHDHSSPYGKAFEDRLRAMRAAGHDVDTLGFLNQDALIRAMDGANALVHTPSEESFGLVIAEALARNLSIFSFATGGVVETAAGQAGAAFVPTGDWNGLEEMLRSWLREGAPRLPAKQGEIRALYHPESVAARHVEIYTEILRSGASR